MVNFSLPIAIFRGAFQILGRWVFAIDVTMDEAYGILLARQISPFGVKINHIPSKSRGNTVLNTPAP